MSPKSYATNREIIAKKATGQLLYSSIFNFERDVKFLKMRGVKFKVSCMDIAKLKKFKPSMKMLLVPMSDSVKIIFDDLEKLEIFSELD